MFEALTRASVDLDDEVGLAEFSELEWEPTEVGVTDESEAHPTPSNRYSWMRTQNSRGRPGLPTPVASATHTTRYRLGDLIAWVEGPGTRRVCIDRDWRWALARAARAYVERSRRGGAGAPESGHSPLDDVRHFMVGLILFVMANGDSSEIDEAITDTLLEPHGAKPVLQMLCGLARRRGNAPDLVAVRLMEAVAEGSRPATRCAQAVVAALTDRQPPMTLIGTIYDELGKLSPKSGATTTGAPLALLMSGLADLSRGDVVVDPACGEGRMLLAAGGLQRDLTLVGRDNDRTSIDTAWALFRLSHQGAEVAPVEDSLRQIDEIPPGDVVLLDPPIAKGAHVRRWLTLATQLCPRGRIVIALPGNTLRPRRREWPQVRDRVVAVIACPAGSKSDTGDATAVWLLGPSAPDRPLLVVNAAPERSSQLTIDDAGELASAVIDWRRTGSWNAPSEMTVRAEEFHRLEIEAAGGELRLKELLIDPREKVVHELAAPDTFDADQVATSMMSAPRSWRKQTIVDQVRPDGGPGSLQELARLLLVELRAARPPDSQVTALESLLVEFVDSPLSPSPRGKTVGRRQQKG